MRKTQIAKKHETVTYLTRHLRVDLLNALKQAAIKADDTTEGVLNRVLAIGIPLFLDALKEAAHSVDNQTGEINGGRTKTRRRNSPRSIEAAKSID